MRKPLVLFLSSVLLCLMWLVPPAAHGAEAPAAEPPADAPAPPPVTVKPAKPSAQEAAATALERKITSLSETLTQFQNEEFQLTMEIMKAQQKANAGLKTPAKAAEELAKGGNSPELREYKQIMLACAQRLQAFDNKFLYAVKLANSLEKELEHIPAEMRARGDQVVLMVNTKHRSNLEKIADVYEKAAEWRTALAIYLSIMQTIPEDKRTAERALREKIANAYDKSGDYKNAVAVYKGIFDSLPEKQRLQDKTVGPGLAAAYEKAGALKEALELYKALLAALPANRKAKEGKVFENKITALEKKVGKSGA